MGITKLAFAKKLFGGGGVKREGTAVPVGEAVDRIYFNIENTSTETNAILSQLTYVDSPLGLSVYIVYTTAVDDTAGALLFIQKIEDEEVEGGVAYVITYTPDIAGIGVNSVTLYVSAESGEEWYNGWATTTSNYYTDDTLIFTMNSVGIGGTGTTELLGMPVGAENEKIKNVLSITLF